MTKYVFNEDFFENIDTESKAYWLGFLYADGCILEMKSHDGIRIPQTVQISISEKDVEILHRFMKDIELDKPIYTGISHNKKSTTQYSRVQVGSKKMCADLIKHGCTPRKTYTLEFPQDIPKDLLRHFVRGYFDGDGSVYLCERMQYDKRRGKEYLQQNFCCSFQGTYKFLKSLDEILSENKIMTRPIRKGHGEIYSLEFGRRDSMIQFFYYIYDNHNVRLDRKYIKFLNCFEHLKLVP
nr:MAG TPA: endonuclease [Caudoviricetes sp.]DAT69676.1 MAG TPA: endonuclease [Caudoviricetes sp.]